MPNIVTGTQNLITQATTWVLIIVPIAAILIVAFQSLMKILAAGEESAIHQRNKAIKTTIIAAIIAECATGLITLVLGFYY